RTGHLVQRRAALRIRGRRRDVRLAPLAQAPAHAERGDDHEHRQHQETTAHGRPPLVVIGIRAVTTDFLFCCRSSSFQAKTTSPSKRRTTIGRVWKASGVGLTARTGPKSFVPAGIIAYLIVRDDPAAGFGAPCWCPTSPAGGAARLSSHTACTLPAAS